MSRGAAPDQLNLGLAFYVKWFRTDKEDCAKADTPIGCKTLLLEDPETGADLGNAGAFAWHDRVPEELKKSFQQAFVSTEYDYDEGATYYYDDEEGLWWTYEEGRNGDIAAKVKTLTDELKLAGVFAWGLGEDGTSFRRLQYLQDALQDEMPELDERGIPVPGLKHEWDQNVFEKAPQGSEPGRESSRGKDVDDKDVREKDEL